MGWLDWLFGGSGKKQAAAPRVASPPPLSRPPYFAIIDVETTGLSPKKDRVLELAVVRVDQGGNVVDEWSTRFNPEGPVGATHIHGITQADIANAPLFRDVAASVVPYIAGLPIAAHNARFDLAFLRAEFRRAGWDLPWLPAYCTLDGSHHYMPHLDRRRLVDCCWSARIPLNDAHSALGDARATAGLLRHYLQAQGRVRPHAALVSVQTDARGVVWPAGPSRAPLAFLPDEPDSARSRPIRVTNAKPKRPALIAQLSKLSLVEVLDEGHPSDPSRTSKPSWTLLRTASSPKMKRPLCRTSSRSTSSVTPMSLTHTRPLCSLSHTRRSTTVMFPGTSGPNWNQSRRRCDCRARLFRS